MHCLYAHEHTKLHSLKRAGHVLMVLQCIMFKYEGTTGKMKKLYNIHVHISVLKQTAWEYLNGEDCTHEMPATLSILLEGF